jgi:hypothetical protein
MPMNSRMTTVVGNILSGSPRKHQRTTPFIYPTEIMYPRKCLFEIFFDLRTKDYSKIYNNISYPYIFFPVLPWKHILLETQS